jgi:Domain of unknown function (DUF5615)
MIPLLADENFDNRILRGILLKDSDIDVVRVQDTQIYQADDPTVLEWAANEGRISRPIFSQFWFIIQLLSLLFEW